MYVLADDFHFGFVVPNVYNNKYGWGKMIENVLGINALNDKVVII